MKHTLYVSQTGIDAIKNLQAFAGKDSGGRPVLACIAFLHDRIAATDSYALGQIETNTTDTLPPQTAAWDAKTAPEKDDRALIVNAKDLKRNLTGPKLPNYGAQTAFFVFDTNSKTLTVTVSETSFTLPLVEGAFPNVGQLMPQDRSISYQDCGPTPTLNVDLIARYAKLNKALGAGKDNAIRLIPGETTLKPVLVSNLLGHTLGIVMPIRDDERNQPVEDDAEAAA